MEGSAGLELGFFLHFCFPLRSEAELLEETFALVYVTDGAFSYTDLWGESMTAKHRGWFIERTAKQKREERAKREQDMAAHRHRRKR